MKLVNVERATLSLGSNYVTPEVDDQKIPKGLFE